MTQTMAQAAVKAVATPELLRDLVDLVGIEPTTSSMPWKRAPSCATGPLLGDTTSYPLRTALSILAERTEIVNATMFSCQTTLEMSPFRRKGNVRF